MNRHTITLMLIGGLVGGLTAGLATFVFHNKVAALTGKIGRGMFFTGIAIAVASGLLYSAVHEFGHVIFAVGLGGEVRSVTWTIFSSEEPHVSYGYLPEGVGPWAGAGGYLFPSAVALLLASLWFIFAHRCSRTFSLLMLVPSVMFLLGNLGCLFELFETRGHMSGLASYYGLGKPGECLLSVAFVLMSLAVYVAIWLRWRRMQMDVKTTAQQCARHVCPDNPNTGQL